MLNIYTLSLSALIYVIRKLTSPSGNNLYALYLLIKAKGSKLLPLTETGLTYELFSFLKSGVLEYYLHRLRIYDQDSRAGFIYSIAKSLSS